VPENAIAILATRETIFFSYEGGALRQWITVTIQNLLGEPVRGDMMIEVEGEGVATSLEIAPGVGDYRCYAPTLWPDHPPVAHAPLRLRVGTATTAATAAVGTHRPWTVYLLSDTCTDYAWAYADEESNRADDAALTAAELDMTEATRGAPEADRNHYNFVHARETAYFLERYPEQAERLFTHIRAGAITFNPFYTMASTCAMSLEELIRQFYPARAWARQYGLDIGYANHQESPTIAWAMATVLAGSGITHLVKSILPYECPWATRLEEPPVFFWEGPDGSRVLVRLRNKDYVEGHFVLRGARAIALALHEEIIPGYEGRGGAYPYSAIALVGCYGDTSPHHRELPAKKAAAIAAYNAQGWAYPKLVNAAHKQFWDDMDAQIAARLIDVPTYRGDYGTSWDAWPSSLAATFAGWRRAQERAAAADALAAIMARLAPARYEAWRAELADGWMNLILLSDHAWNGADDANRVLNAALRRGWQATANRCFDAVIAAGLDALAPHVGGAGEGRVLVVNTLAWPRDGVARLVGQAAEATVVDMATGQPVASQYIEDKGQSALYCQVSLPSLGYRVLAAQPRSDGPASGNGPWVTSERRLEGPYYALEVSPDTGGVVSLYDKVRKRELVDAASAYHLNQCLYLSDGVEHTPRAASVEMGPCGPVLGQLIVRSALKNTELTTTMTLYAKLDRVDIRNELRKLPTDEKQELDFAFPFAVSDRQYRFEAPGAIVTPGQEQRPGAGQAVTAVRHFVDIFNDDYGVTLAQIDSGLVEFGHRTTLEDPREPDPRNSTVLAVALDNSMNWREGARDQDGVDHFTFRFSLRGHDGGFDPAAAVRFGEEASNEPLAAPLTGSGGGDLPSGTHSFIGVEANAVVLTAVKVAEEEGLLARLWNTADQAETATLQVAGLGAWQGVRATDLLEHNLPSTSLTAGGASVAVPARGLAAARLLFA